MAARKSKILNCNMWLHAGSECMKTSVVFERPVYFSNQDQEKWNKLLDRFVLLHYFVKHPDFAGSPDKAFAKLMKGLHELDQDFINQIKVEATRKNIQLSAPSCYHFVPPLLWLWPHFLMWRWMTAQMSTSIFMMESMPA